MKTLFEKFLSIFGSYFVSCIICQRHFDNPSSLAIIICIILSIIILLSLITSKRPNSALDQMVVVVMLPCYILGILAFVYYILFSLINLNAFAIAEFLKSISKTQFYL